MCVFNPPADINFSASLGLICKIPLLSSDNSFGHSRRLCQTFSSRTERKAELGSAQKLRAEAHYSFLLPIYMEMEEQEDKESSGDKSH